MKKLVLIALTLLGLLFAVETYAQVGVGTNQPDRSSAMDIVSTKRGLLIPRIDIPDVLLSDPVNNPAHSLLVFNNGNNGDTPQGFYWWDENANDGDGKWRAVTAEIIPGDDAVEVLGMGYINTLQNVNGDWEISFQGGAEGDVLVTNDQNEPEWVPLTGFLEEVVINGENGVNVTLDALTGEWLVKLGGELTQPLTEIITDGDTAQLAITNLTDLTGTYQDMLDNDEELYVIVMGEDGILKKIHINEFLEEVNVEVDLDFLNGITQAGDQVKLGGDLIELTTINTDSEEGYNLAVTGLKEESAGNFVTVDDSGVLRTAQKSVAFAMPVTGNVEEGDGYTTYTAEVLVEVDITILSSGTEDVVLTLPPAETVQGQVISVKLSGEDEGNNMLSIKDNGNEIAYGALPYQMWIFKSNGTNWILVSQ